MSDSGTLTFQLSNRVAYLTFGHPAGNAFPSTQLQQLSEQLQTISQMEAVSVIVLQSQGTGAFCAGASFDELLSLDNPEDGARFFSGFANVINTMRRGRQPIIGRVHGKAVGGGVGLAAACDYVLATENASIRLSELAIGIGPFVIAPAVERKVGISGLAELALAPTQWKTADWAHSKGLYAQLHPDAETLEKATISFAEELASYHPDALAEMKKALWTGTEHWDELLTQRAAISGRLVLSDFTREALAAFRK